MAALQAPSDDSPPLVEINANRRARYDVVAKVMAAARRNGIERLGFVGQERFSD